jgi:hypothetical protein
MWENCFNIQFKYKNVVLERNVQNCEIKLARGQYRFALYSTINHPNFLINIEYF